MAEVLPSGLATLIGRALYTSSAADATVTGANTRLSMLPPDIRTGNAYISVPAGMLPVGAHLLLIGAGTIGARSVGTPGFNFIPWVTPSGGSKTDLPGFNYAPLLGTDGICRIPWMKFTQTNSGIRTAGFIDYGANYGQLYSIPVNPGGLGNSGTLPTVIASDPNVDRIFGVDGFWGTGADTREYVRCRSITVTLATGA